MKLPTNTTPPIFTIGIICNGYNNEDIAYYKDEFKKINKIYKDKVRLLFIGLPGELPELKGVEYEYTKPVSINHYFKHLYALKIDLLFIPIKPSVFNVTSENYNKFIEASILSIPVITLKWYPYELLIRDGRNGFLYENKDKFIDYLKNLIDKFLPEVKKAGSQAYETYLQYMSYSAENTKMLIDAFD